MYAVNLMTGRQRWELSPSIDPQTEKNVNAIANSPVNGPGPIHLGPEPGELPRAPWLTAPAFHHDELLFGTPDGLWAVAADDGAPRWRLHQQDVGAVDLPPLVRDGTAYFASQGWIDGNVDAARMRAAYAIRLEGPPVSAPTLTASPARLRHWPLLAAAAALAGLIVTAIERPTPRARPRWWLDALPVLLILAAAAMPAGWACLHRPTIHPLQPGDVPMGWQEADIGSPPTVMLCAPLTFAYAAALVAVWRVRKFLLATTVSLLLGAAVITLWIRGRWVDELFNITTYDLGPDRVQQHSTYLMSGLGGLSISRSQTEESMASGLFKARGNSFSWSRAFREPAWYPVAGPIRSGEEKGTERQWHGFEVQSREYLDRLLAAQASGSVSVTVPDWTLLVPSAAILAVWLMRLARQWRKRRRALAGRCPVCNYSLTGNISGTCPECGTPIFGRVNVVGGE